MTRNNNGSALKDIKSSFTSMDLPLYLKHTKKPVSSITVNPLKLMSH